MKEELLAAIDSNLPSMVGDALKKRLEQGDKAEKDLEKKIKSYDTLTRDYNLIMKDLREEKDKNRSLQASNEHLENMLNIRAPKLEFREAVVEVKEQHAKEKVDLMKECFGMVFRNTVVKKDVLSKAPSFVQEHYSSSGHNIPVSVDGGEFKDTLITEET
ncbi:MAG: hypothetical protein HRU21_09255 [Pseudomonadales bacterium]|nr:hypothetical protein [Pseudomonadales bacterium]